MALQKQQRVVDSLLHLAEDMSGRLKRLEEFPTCSFGSGTSHSGFTRFNPVELGRGAVELLNRG